MRFCRVAFLTVLAAWLAADGAHAQPASPAISVLETRTLDAQDLPWDAAAKATHALRLTLVVLHETAWGANEVLGAVKRMAPLFAQCAVRVVAVELRVLDAPPRFRDYRTPVSRELARLVPVPRPAIYFVADTLNDPAFDAEAIGRANSRNRPELADTVWVAAGTRDLHLVLAHELVHVLADSGAHSIDAGNLMRADSAPHNTRLTRGQCDAMRTNGERDGLLAPIVYANTE
jgi:hypothetical protein